MVSTQLRVYVPAKETIMRRVLMPGSAIVGSEHDGTVVIDFEGDKYGAFNGDRDAMFRQAAGRHVARYPTVARMYVLPVDVVDVGSYDVDTGSLTIEDREAYDEWVT